MLYVSLMSSTAAAKLAGLPGPNDGDPHMIGKRQEVFSLTMDVVEVSRAH